MWFVGGPVKEYHLGMELEIWRTAGGDCIAEFGTGENWATLYGIRSGTQGKGQATAVLERAKQHYLSQNKRFGSSVALNERMRGILQRLGITEYR